MRGVIKRIWLRPKVFLIPLFLICIFNLLFQKQIFERNMTESTSLADILTYQFNTYFYIHLFFLPAFIIESVSFFCESKFTEFTMTRSTDRKSYFIYKEKELFIFTFLYRLVEIIVSSIIFILSYLPHSLNLNTFSLTSIIQRLLFVSPKTMLEMASILVCVQLLIFLYYLFFAHIILYADCHIGNITVAAGIAIAMDFVLLVMIKANYWFEDSFLLQLLPHHNTFLEYVFAKPETYYNFERILIAIVYWIVIGIAMNIAVYKGIKSKDFVYSFDSSEREIV